MHRTRIITRCVSILLCLLHAVHQGSGTSSSKQFHVYLSLSLTNQVGFKEFHGAAHAHYTAIMVDSRDAVVKVADGDLLNCHEVILNPTHDHLPHLIIVRMSVGAMLNQVFVMHSEGNAPHEANEDHKHGAEYLQRMLQLLKLERSSKDGSFASTDETTFLAYLFRCVIGGGAGAMGIAPTGTQPLRVPRERLVFQFEAPCTRGAQSMMCGLATRQVWGYAARLSALIFGKEVALKNPPCALNDYLMSSPLPYKEKKPVLGFALEFDPVQQPLSQFYCAFLGGSSKSLVSKSSFQSFREGMKRLVLPLSRSQFLIAEHSEFLRNYGMNRVVIGTHLALIGGGSSPALPVEVLDEVAKEEVVSGLVVEFDTPPSPLSSQSRGTIAEVGSNTIEQGAKDGKSDGITEQPQKGATSEVALAGILAQAVINIYEQLSANTQV